MDASVNELEFSTLRSLRSVQDALAAEGQADDAPSQQHQAGSRQVSSQVNSQTSSQADLSVGSFPREPLIAPPQPPSDLDLDLASREHLQTLIRQSVENVGLQGRLWEELLAPLPTEILALIDDHAIQQIARTKRALARAEVQYAAACAEIKAREAKGKSSKTGKDKRAFLPEKGKDAKDVEKPSMTEKHAREAEGGLLDLEETARHLLLEEVAEQQDTAHGSMDGAEKILSHPELQGLPKLTNFLICVSEEVGSTRRASFDANAFTGAPLFQDEDDDPDEAEKFALQEDSFSYIGGTIHLRAPEREWNRIEKILTLIVYAACHLKLEVHLLRDTGCSRPPPLPEKDPNVGADKPKVAREASDATIQAVSHSSSSSPHDLVESPETVHENLVPLQPSTSASSDEHVPTPKTSSSKKWSRAGLVSLLFRDRSPAEPVNKLRKRFGGRLKMHRTRSLHRKSEDTTSSQLAYPLSPQEQLLAMPGAFVLEDWELVAPDKKVVVDMARTEEEQAGEILTAPGSPTESANTPASAELAGTLVDDKHGLSADPTKANERFKRVIERLEKAALSVSPDVHFPPPSLLQTLREQEQQEEHNDNASIPGRPLLGRLQSFTSAIDPTTPSPAVSDGLPSSASVPALLSGTTGSISARPDHPMKISLEARSGLTSLMAGNNSLDGTFRHQSIPCLFTKSAPGSTAAQSWCQPPLWRKLAYYDLARWCNPWSLLLNSTVSSTISLGDQTLSGFISMLAKSDDLRCQVECGRPWSEHTFSILHGDRRISFSLKESLLASSAPERLLHWIVCSQCGKRSEIEALSEATLSLSFGKYIELLLYDKALHPPATEFCTHAADPFSLVRTFLRDSLEIRAIQEKLDLYTLRMPTAIDASMLQDNVVQNVDREESLQAVKSALEEEVRSFFASLQESRSKLSDPFASDDDAARSAVEGLLQELDVSEIEESDRDMLSRTASAELADVNDLRCRFGEICHRYSSMVHAFQQLPEVKSNENIPTCDINVPEYLKDDQIHIIPAGNSVVLRERELSSFIAYALTSSHYLHIMSTISGIATGDSPAQATAVAHDTASASTSSTASRATSPALGEDSHLGGDGRKASDWELSAKIKRTVKPSGSILSLKATTPRSKLNDIFSLAEDSRRSRQHSPAPGSRGVDRVNEDDQVLEALLTATKSSAPKASPLGSARSPVLPSLISSLTNRRHVSEATATKALADIESTSPLAALDASVTHGRAESVRSVSTVSSQSSGVSYHSQASNETLRGDEAIRKETEEPVSCVPPKTGTIEPSKLSALSTISGFINRGLRINHLDLEQKSGPDVSTGPHVKLSFRHEHKKMSCIVYYAREFAALRKACGLPEALYANSLERSHALVFSGGKTSAGFWITEDQRLVLKEMRTSWNISEVDAMLTFAPNYLEYLMTSEKPSLLTKIFGMYTCKIKNIKTGEKQKVDFVVMEHLFFDQHITAKFDLKGIPTRVAPSRVDGQTLWDADWLETSRTRTLLRPHHNAILREAIEADTAFLQLNNVMDYSALVGIDDKNHTFTIGLIDTLGIFNLAKAIESNSKRVLQAERTIIPPDDYAARFKTALGEYFIAIPEKFSKSPGDEGIPVLHCPL